ncbi:unnamed protein product [Anisakis simplex]|uniref:Transposase n=1 Tax=Anisakis simplex TaxID=6269 RepID=A0A0M3KDX0_ANISI|nr:unnamed protein product [Anisakis simplex]
MTEQISGGGGGGSTETLTDHDVDQLLIRYDSIVIDACLDVCTAFTWIPFGSRVVGQQLIAPKAVDLNKSYETEANDGRTKKMVVVAISTWMAIRRSIQSAQMKFWRSNRFRSDRTYHPKTLADSGFYHVGPGAQLRPQLWPGHIYRTIRQRQQYFKEQYN